MTIEIPCLAAGSTGEPGSLSRELDLADCRFIGVVSWNLRSGRRWGLSTVTLRPAFYRALLSSACRALFPRFSARTFPGCRRHVTQPSRAHLPLFQGSFTSTPSEACGCGRMSAWVPVFLLLPVLLPHPSSEAQQEAEPELVSPWHVPLTVGRTCSLSLYLGCTVLCFAGSL